MTKIIIDDHDIIGVFSEKSSIFFFFFFLEGGGSSAFVAPSGIKITINSLDYRSKKSKNARYYIFEKK